MSAKRDREARRDRRLREEEREGATERRQRLVKLASALGFLALAIVAVLIVVSQSQNGGGDSDSIGDAELVDRELAGIPQTGMVLGEPGAKVTLIEFGDLQCPVCKGYAEEILPEVIENRVRNGEARLDFRNYTILGSQSESAGAAAIAAGKQGRGWNFVELFYRNQGTEGSGYATDEFLTAIARAAGVRDIARWDRDRRSEAVLAEVAATTAEAQRLGFSGTPSFAVTGPATTGVEALGTPGSASSIESAVEEATG
ncbi:MAG TPA: thioredoxin domain-containing protein [Solirubrobacterales bacterium]|nr:thioredoxin domain-containing protein [Solirubrobacterales bacterium]